MLISLCHLGANLVPSGFGCDVFGHAASGIGLEDDHRQRAGGGELWAMRAPDAEPRADRPGQPVYAIAEPP